jgi:hypothetical protein
VRVNLSEKGIGEGASMVNGSIKRWRLDERINTLTPEEQRHSLRFN